MSSPIGGTHPTPRRGRRSAGWRLPAAVGGTLAAACGAVAQPPAARSPALAAPPAMMPPLVIPAPAMMPQPGVVQAQAPMPLPGGAAPMAQPPAGGAAQPPAGGVAPPPAAQLPVPRPDGPFTPDQQRLRLLGGPLGVTPQPSAEEIKRMQEFIEGVIDPTLTLDLIQNRSRIILLKQTPTLVQIAQPGVASYNFLPNRPLQLIIQGNQPGLTVLNVFFADPRNPGKEQVLSYLVRVLPDPELLARLKRVYQELENEVNKAYPRSRIKLSLVGDKLMVTGQAHDASEATQILQILRANAPGGSTGAGAGQAPVLNVAPAAPDPNNPLAGGGTPGISNYQTSGGPNIINNLRVPGEQQIMLRVVVAEVNRAAARSVGLTWSITNNRGIRVFSVNGGGAGGNLPILLDNGRVPLALEALRTLNYARSLSEPTLVALNGQSAFSQVGGQFPVPVIGGFGTVGGVQGVSFVPFGVSLQFTPQMTDRDRIRMNVFATVSTRDNAGGGSIGGTAVPGLNTRTFQTTVEMREGQTFAIAGLIQNNLGANASRVPFVGDLPIIGGIARNHSTSMGEQELVVLVTPELVHALEPNELSHLPGSDIFEPGDLEFYLHGRLESRRSYDYRSPAMTDIHRMLKYRRCEQQYLIGPSGHAEQLLLGSDASK